MKDKKCQICGEIKEDVKIRKVVKAISDDKRLIRKEDAFRPQFICGKCWEYVTNKGCAPD